MYLDNCGDVLSLSPPCGSDPWTVGSSDPRMDALGSEKQLTVLIRLSPLASAPLIADCEGEGPLSVALAIIAPTNL